MLVLLPGLIRDGLSCGDIWRLICGAYYFVSTPEPGSIYDNLSCGDIWRLIVVPSSARFQIVLGWSISKVDRYLVVFAFASVPVLHEDWIRAISGRLTIILYFELSLATVLDSMC